MIFKQYFDTNFCKIIIELAWNVAIIWQHPSSLHVSLFKWSRFVVLELYFFHEMVFPKRNNDFLNSRCQTYEHILHQTFFCSLLLTPVHVDSNFPLTTFALKLLKWQLLSPEVYHLERVICFCHHKKIKLNFSKDHSKANGFSYYLLHNDMYNYCLPEITTSHTTSKRLGSVWDTQIGNN